MKALHLLIIVTGFIGSLPSGAATLLLDEFSSGNLSLASGGMTSDSGPYTPSSPIKETFPALAHLIGRLH